MKEWFKPDMHVLEVGGGNGFQASILASWGCHVSSIDISKSKARPLHSHFPVQVYDGRHVPFPDRTFDAVFSSNVLEHVPHLPEVLDEISRVVKKEGIAVHILPSSSWRFWTSVSLYPYLVKHLFEVRGSSPTSDQHSADSTRSRDWKTRLRGALFPGPHGAYPTAIHELFSYSRTRWLRVFRAHGFDIVKCSSNGLFYTGYMIFPSVSLVTRRRLAQIMGSACHIYIVQVGPPKNI